jgi:hypothetical protein
MANAALLLTIIAALFAVFGLIRFGLGRRRAARSLITTPSSTSQAGDHSGAAAETDAERRERLVERAFLAGAVPPVWYRHAKAALAAEDAEAERSRG